LLQQMHKTLYGLNVGVDFVTPETADLARYKVILVPPLYVASDRTLATLAEYARGGGQLVVTFKSGFTNEYDTVRAEMAPGPLRAATGLHYQEFSTLKSPLALKGDPFGVGAGNKVSTWAEMVELDTAKALAYYDHPFFGKYAAVARNQFGKGAVTFEGTVLSDELQRAVVLDVLKTAGLAGTDQALPAAVRVKHGTANSGHRMHYYLNYSAAAQPVAYAYGAGADVLTGRAVAAGSTVTVGPWDVLIVEEK